MQPDQNERLVRRRETHTITGVPPRTQREMEAAGEFPLPYKIGIRSVAHKLSELQEWIDGRPRDDGPRQSNNPRNRRQS